MKNKPLFNVQLKIWENWQHYWNSNPWWLRKLASKDYDEIGKTKFVAGAFDPYTKCVHLFLDEIGQGAIARLDLANVFTNGNYQLELAKEILTTLMHELIHSLDVFSNEKYNENHEINRDKLEQLMKKSNWYAELIRICDNLDGNVFNVKDSSKESDSPTDNLE